MATLRVENKYGLVGVDGENGQRAIAAEDRSVWGFAKGSLVQPGPDAIRAKTGTWLRHVDPDGILYATIDSVIAPLDLPSNPKTMNDKFSTLREKLLTHALAAFGPGHGALPPKDKVEEALAIFRVLAASPERLPKEEELDAKRAAFEKVAKGKVEIVDDSPSAPAALCGHEPKLGASCLHRYTDGHMMPFDVGPMTPSRQCLLPKGHPTDVHSTREVLWTSSGEAPKVVTLTHTRTLVDVAEVGPGKATEWEVPEDGWYIVLHDRSSRADVVVPQGAILRANGVVATVSERTAVPPEADSYGRHGTPVRVTLAGEIPTDGAEMFLDEPIQGIKSAHLHRVKDGIETWFRVKAKAPPNGAPVAIAVAIAASPKVERAGWYLVPSEPTRDHPHGTPLLVSRPGPYTSLNLTVARTTLANAPIPIAGMVDVSDLDFGAWHPSGTDVWVVIGHFGESVRASLRYLPAALAASPPCPNVAERVTSEATPKPKVSAAGWYLIPASDVGGGVAEGAKITFRPNGLSLTATASTDAGQPIPVAALVDLFVTDPDGLDGVARWLRSAPILTCDGAFTWLGRVTLRYLTP